MEEVKELFDTPKRGNRKRIKDLGSINIYNFYRKENKGKNPQDIAKFRAVIKDLNNMIIERMVMESEEFQMPYRLGTLRVKKCGKIYKSGKLQLFPDFKESRKLGYLVYHDPNKLYSFKWDKHKAIVTNQTAYVFKPSRTMKRYLAKAIKVHKKDYFG